MGIMIRLVVVAGLGLSIVACSPAVGPAVAADDPLPQPTRDLATRASDRETSQTLVVAGGCFWCVEAVFEAVAGVKTVTSGYAGGSADDANYQLVSAGRTQHAEVVAITYDPQTISYGTLLRIFFATHDPTQLNRQGPDHGRQYRSAVFYANDEEKSVAADYIKQLSASDRWFDRPIVTTLEKLEHFYPAETYHQDFVQRHPDHGYVRAWVPQKLQKLKKHYAALLKEKP